MPASTPQITASFGEPIKQYAGQVQVKRAVKVECPGKHFPGLTPQEQKLDYQVTAMEFRERYVFERHTKAWGQAHTGPGIRFVSDSDAIDDPDHKGFWTTLSLWNRWRDQTYRSDREAEKQYLDELPAAPAARAPAAEQQAPAGAPIKEHFTLHSTGTHTVGGRGKMAGQTIKCTFWACKKEGCPRGQQKPIKQIGSATGDLFSHLDSCQPALALRLRAASPHSPVRIGDDGEEVSACDLNPSSYTISPAPVHPSTISPRTLPTCGWRNLDGTDPPSDHHHHHHLLRLSLTPAPYPYNQYELYSFEELLPHHIRFTQKIFRSFGHLYETRADTGLQEYIQGYDKRASLPHEQTCQQIMQVPYLTLALTFTLNLTLTPTPILTPTLTLTLTPTPPLTLTQNLTQS